LADVDARRSGVEPFLPFEYNKPVTPREEGLFSRIAGTFRGRSRSPQRREISPLRNKEVTVIDDIVAGAPVQRIALERPDGLHGHHSEDLHLFERRVASPTLSPARTIEVERPIEVPAVASNPLQDMKAGVSSFWHSFTGHAEELREEMPKGLQHVEANIADKLDRYEISQVRQAEQALAHGRTDKFHSHMSRAHAADSASDKLRGSEDKENVIEVRGRF
jgi:hypothetical protein